MSDDNNENTTSEEIPVPELVATTKKKVVKKKAAKKKVAKKKAAKTAVKKAAKKTAANPANGNPLGIHSGSNRARIFDYFMKHPKAAVSRAEATKGIFGNNDQESRTLFNSNVRVLEQIMSRKGWGSIKTTKEEGGDLSYVFTPGS